MHCNWLSCYLFILATLLIIVYFIFRSIFKSLVQAKNRRRLENAIKNRREFRQKQFQQLKLELKSFDVKEAQKILHLNFQTLSEKLKSRKLKVIDVLQTYQLKALEAQEKCNCICLFIEEAIQWATELEENGDRSLPLFGIPVSIKESTGVKGYDATMGYVSRLDKAMEKDSVLVATLKSQGAIPFCLTNIPQSLLAFSCSNPIYGATTHPQNAKLIPGGSSGGESALIAFGGSILGVGSDVGGSIRMPAILTGICGFKPGGTRVSKHGASSSMPGRQVIGAALGPMSRDVDGLVAFMRAILCDKHFESDCYIPPVYFNEDLYNRKPPLKIGYYDDDGFYDPMPACRRALEIAVSHLDYAGHIMIPFKMPDVLKAIILAEKTIFIDRGLFLLEQFQRDTVVDPYLTSLFQMVKKCNSRFSKLWASEKTKVELSLCPNDLKDLRMTYVAIAEYRDRVIKMWEEAQLDALICPGFGLTAVPYAHHELLIGPGSYSFLYNLLDWPAGVVPVCKVSREDHQQLLQSGHVTKAIKQAFKDATSHVGLPVGVQCVSLPFREEVCLRVMKDLEKQLTKNDVPISQNGGY